MTNRKKPCNNSNLRAKGMTLIELMITVVIIGILASMTYPSYTQYSIKANRSAALADLAKIQLHLESGYNGSYASAASGVISSSTCSFCEIDTSKYSLSISPANPTSDYVIIADPQGRQENDSCLSNTSEVITLSKTGAKSPADCW
ncbi:type IV pilin protein [Vibrio mexicanus]|uniref:type IV pilin protein n=1 Tax=Vibrio mexicanus TaxID=1004326 RepID=UPI000ADAA34C